MLNVYLRIVIIGETGSTNVEENECLTLSDFNITSLHKLESFHVAFDIERETDLELKDPTANWVDRTAPYLKDLVAILRKSPTMFASIIWSLNMVSRKEDYPLQHRPSGRGSTVF